MRAAIRELQELGLVSRRKKVGTRVEAASPSGSYRQSLAIEVDPTRPRILLTELGVGYRLAR